MTPTISYSFLPQPRDGGSRPPRPSGAHGEVFSASVEDPPQPPGRLSHHLVVKEPPRPDHCGVRPAAPPVVGRGSGSADGCRRGLPRIPRCPGGKPGWGGRCDLPGPHDRPDPSLPGERRRLFHRFAGALLAGLQRRAGNVVFPLFAAIKTPIGATLRAIRDGVQSGHRRQLSAIPSNTLERCDHVA